MPRSVRALALMLLCLFAPAAVYVVAAQPVPKPKETAKYGIYFGASRIGSMVSRTFDVTYEEKPALKMDADTNLKITALGSSVEQQLNLSFVQDKQGRPLNTH